MNYHGENTLHPMNQRVYFLNSYRISGHFDTTFITIAQIKQISQESKEQKIANILNVERVYFLVTCVTSSYSLNISLTEKCFYCGNHFYFSS